MKGDVSKSLVFFLLVAGCFGANGKDRSIPPDDLVYCTVCHGVICSISFGGSFP